MMNFEDVGVREIRDLGIRLAIRKMDSRVGDARRVMHAG